MFMGSRFDHYSPRAIVVLARDHVEGRVELDGLLLELIYMCTLCGNCNVRCPSRIDVVGIVDRLRRSFVVS